MESMESRIRRLMKESEVPSRRSNRNRSGRQVRKQWQSQQAQQRAGGLGVMTAMLEGPEGVFRDLCNTVPSSTGFDPDGQPYRSPNEGRRSSGAQRGQ